jgi:hypothetical protein
MGGREREDEGVDEKREREREREDEGVPGRGEGCRQAE